MSILKGTVLKAGVPNANGDVYTEECLSNALDKNMLLRVEDDSLVVEIEERDRRRLVNGIPMDLRHYECGDKCEDCGRGEGSLSINYIENDFVKINLELCTAATHYSWDGTGENPNRPMTLCQYCKEKYYDHWDEMWKEYRFSQGC